MRHRKSTVKLGRTSAHRRALFASLVCNLIEHGRVRTTLAKARVVRSWADRMVTLGKRGTLADRRLALERLHRPERVARLFRDIAPAFSDRRGGYTRVLKLGRRGGDGAEMAIVEWTNYTPPEPRRKKSEKKAEDKKADK